MGSILKLKIFEITTIKKIELCLLGVIVAIALFIGFKLYGRIIIEDAFITYRYARNLAEGLGFVYNPGEKVLSTTTPLYTLILALSYFISKEIPSNSYLLSVLCLVCSIILIYKIFARENLGIVGLLSSLLLVVNIYIILTFGMETCFYLLLLLFSIYFYLNNKLALTAFFLGLSVLTRIDGFIMVGALAIHYILMNFKSITNLNTIKRLFRPLLIFIVTITPWFLFSIVYFEQLFPLTLKAKMMQYSSGLWPSCFTSEFFEILISQYLYFIPFFIFGCIFIIIKLKGYSVLLVYFALYCLAYSKLPYYHWYNVPPLTIFLMVTSIGFYNIFTIIFQWFKKEEISLRPAFKKIATLSVVCSLLLLLLIPVYPLTESTSNLLKNTKGFSQDVNNRFDFYKYIGERIKNETPSNASVGLIEIGIIGWYSERRIIDYCGLLQPYGCVNMGTGKIVDFYKPDYIVYSPLGSWIAPVSSLCNYQIIDRYTISNEKWFLCSRANLLAGKFDEIKTNLPNTHYSLNILDVSNVAKISVFEHPLIDKQGYISFENVTIPKNATLKFSIALDPQVWSPDKGDGVFFEIHIKENETENPIFSEYIDPKNNPEDRKWHDFAVELSDYADKNVTIIFATSPNMDTNYDWAWWGEPRILHEKVSFDKRS